MTGDIDFDSEKTSEAYQTALRIAGMGKRILLGQDKDFRDEGSRKTDATFDGLLRRAIELTTNGRVSGGEREAYQLFVLSDLILEKIGEPEGFGLRAAARRHCENLLEGDINLRSVGDKVKAMFREN